MDIDIFKKLIESACRDGEITQEEKIYLEQKAKDVGISARYLNYMIDSELGKSGQIKNKKNDQKQSGFASNDNRNSGFETPKSGNNSKSGFTTDTPSDKQSGFTQSPENNKQSGFTQSPENDKKSGFVVKNDENEQEKNEPPSISQQFYDVTPLKEQGGMSLIQKAKYHGKWIIVKRLKPELKDNATYKSLLYKEFENTYHLDHPNIVRLLDKGEDKDGIFYTMEYVDGRSLEKLYGENGIESLDLIQKILRQILDALTYVHKKQVYHRDLKPDNILITYRGDNVKILDFGLAAADSFDDNMTKVGTPKYAAPEQKTKGYTADHRADIYSVGLILLEMLTGKTDKRAVTGIKNEELKNIVLTCLQNNPDDRFQDCQDIFKLLNKASTISKTLPTWLEQTIKDYAKDGIITKNEKRVLLLEARQNNIDKEVVQAYLNVEIEKAKERIRQEKEAQRAQKAREYKLNLQQQARQQQYLDKQRRLEAALKEKEREVQRLRRMKAGNPPKSSRSRIKTLIYILIIVIIGFVLYKNDVFTSWFGEEKTEQTTNEQNPVWYVDAAKLNLRSTKTTHINSNIINQYGRGTKVELIEIQGDWAKVKVKGKTGFMAKKYLTDKKPE